LTTQLEEIKDAIKRNVREQAPEAEEFWITRSDGVGRPIKVARRVTDKFDSKGFERSNGATYASWKKPVESWALGWA
jgi:ribosomal protein S19E (S16A)